VVPAPAPVAGVGATLVLGSAELLLLAALELLAADGVPAEGDGVAATGDEGAVVVEGAVEVDGGGPPWSCPWLLVVAGVWAPVSGALTG